MTTLARMSGAGESAAERQLALPPGPGALVARLHEECDRQVPFSRTKLLLREAAVAIERLEAEVARMAAGLAEERALRRAR